MTRPDAALAAITRVLDLHQGGHICADNSVSQPRWFNDRAGTAGACPTNRWLNEALVQVKLLHTQVHEAAHDDDTVTTVARGLLAGSDLSELGPEEREGWMMMARQGIEALAAELDRDPEQEARVRAAQDRLTPPLFPRGSTIYAVDQQGATFALTTAEDQQAVATEEAARGALELTTFTCTAPRDLTGDEAADYACANGPGLAVSGG